jgi:hypothetical protein
MDGMHSDPILHRILRGPRPVLPPGAGMEGEEREIGCQEEGGNADDLRVG